MTLLTAWGEDLDTHAPLPEYPRPQLVRSRWQNLNGRWECAFTPFAASDPLSVADQVASIYSGTGGYLDRIKTDRV